MKSHINVLQYTSVEGFLFVLQASTSAAKGGDSSSFPWIYGNVYSTLMHKQLRTRLMMIAIWSLVLLIGLYGVQYFLALMDMGQPQARGEALQRIAQARLNQMTVNTGITARVVGAFGGRSKCSWLNLQQLWGRCATISIDILNADGLEQARVERIAIQLTSELIRPCRVLASVGSDAAAFQSLDCEKDLSLHDVTSRVVLVVPGPGGINNTSNSVLWNRTIVRSIGLYRVKGE